MSERILVLGSTGTVGRRLVPALRSRGADVAAAGRSGPVPFDWSDPATFEPAADGASAVFVLVPDGVELDPEFLEVATGAGVRRLVLLSSRAIEEMGDERLLAAERHVKAAGVDWTVVRPHWFDQNFDEGFFRDAIVAGELAIPLGDVKQGFNDAQDIAEMAAVALTGEGHAGETYELNGPDLLSFGDAAAVIAAAAGREVRYVGDEEGFVRSATAQGMPQDAARRLAADYRLQRDLGDTVLNDTVERVTGRPPVAFRDYAENAATSGAWRG